MQNTSGHQEEEDGGQVTDLLVSCVDYQIIPLCYIKCIVGIMTIWAMLWLIARTVFFLSVTTQWISTSLTLGSVPCRFAATVMKSIETLKD